MVRVGSDAYVRDTLGVYSASVLLMKYNHKRNFWDSNNPMSKWASKMVPVVSPTISRLVGESLLSSTEVTKLTEYATHVP